MFNPYLWVMIFEFSLLPLVIHHCAMFIIADITLFTIFGLNPITWLFFIFKEEQSCLTVFANDSSPILGRSLYNSFVRAVQRPNHFLILFISMCIIIIYYYCYLLLLLLFIIYIHVSFTFYYFYPSNKNL